MKTDPEAVKQVIEYLDRVGAKIGMTADTVWPWLVRQQELRFMFALSVLIVGVFLIPFALRISDKYHPFDDSEKAVDLRRICRCITIIAAPVLIAIGIIATMANMLHFLNPEYYALEALFRMIRHY